MSFGGFLSRGWQHGLDFAFAAHWMYSLGGSFGGFQPLFAAVFHKTHTHPHPINRRLGSSKKKRLIHPWPERRLHPTCRRARSLPT